jgi:hypothetical protein
MMELDGLIEFCVQDDIQVISIHQGILDKAFNTKEDAIADWVRRLKLVVPFVVVHSDRGESLLPRLPVDVRFVQYTAIESWFNYEEVSKYFLVQTLLSGSRRG